MSRINLGGGKSISIRDYAVGLGRTGNVAGAVRYAQGKDDTRQRGVKQLQRQADERRQRAADAERTRLDNVGTPE
jgi:hypothetical protein